MASVSLPSPPLQDNFDVEHRLREVEDRLREAIEELRRPPAQGRNLTWCLPCDHAVEEPLCVANAISNLCQSFLLSYGVRVSFWILLHTFKLARCQSYSSLLDLKFLDAPARTCGLAVKEGGRISKKIGRDCKDGVGSLQRPTQYSKATSRHLA